MSQREILLIDDNIFIQEIIADFLRNNGYPVDAAANGMQALNMLQGKKYDLIVCDIKMPGMDGFEFKTQVPVDKQAPIIFISAGSKDHDFIKKLDELKAIGHIVLEKPFSKDDFLRKVHQLLPKVF